MNPDITASAIKLVNSIIDNGVDPNQFVLNLIEYFRSAMLIKEGKDLLPLLDLPKDEVKSIQKQAESLTTEDILYILYSLINTNSAMRRSSSPRIPLELLAVKLSQKETIVSLDEIISRLDMIDKGTAPAASIPVREPLPQVSPAAVKNNPAPAKVINDALVKEAPAVDNKGQDQAAIEGLDSMESNAALYRIREVIPQVIQKIRQEKIYIASCLSEGKLVSFNNNIVTMGFLKKNTFHKESLEKTQNKKLIEDHFTKLLNARVGVDFIILKQDESQEGQEEASTAAQARENRNPLKKALAEPIIQTAMDMFDGNIMKFL